MNLNSPALLPATAFHRASYLKGSGRTLPLVLGALPFALITGAITVGAGISALNSMAMSLLIAAGASQIAAIDLITQQAPLLIVILTGLIINLRLVMYSASIAPYLQDIPAWKKLFFTFILTDQAYAVSLMEFTSPESRVHRPSYYLGAAVTVFVIWMLGVLAGVLLGKAIPASWSLDFAVPLTFMLLLISALKNKPAWMAASASVFVSVAAGALPYNLNIILGAIAGILTGYWTERSKTT